jgi:hypothetical protein
MQKNKLYCMVILNLILPSPFSLPFFQSELRSIPSWRHLVQLNILDHVAGRARYRTSTLSALPRVSGRGTYPTVDPDFLASSPSGLDGLDRQRHSMKVRHCSAPPFTSRSLVKQDEISTRKEEKIRERRRNRDGRTGETTRFPTPSLIFSLIRSLTSLPSGKVCRNLIKGSRNCMRCESGGVESDSEGGGWA